MTKTKFIPTAVVLAILGVAAYVFVPSMLEAINRRDDAVIIMVTFDPVTRSGVAPAGRTLKDQVTIQVDVGAKSFAKETATTSPWTVAVYPQNDRERVHVWAEQFYGSWLRCEIFVRGDSVFRQQKPGPAYVNCYHTMRLP